jgi:hypothetical protein
MANAFELKTRNAVGHGEDCRDGVDGEQNVGGLHLTSTASIGVAYRLTPSHRRIADRGTGRERHDAAHRAQDRVPFWWTSAFR